MKALVLEAENQMPELRDVQQPKPGKGEVLVKVSRSGVNYADTMMRRGFYLQKPEFPFIPGFETSSPATA
jgi:NADPH:quinone reductase-like Zn-dependent oxidoreductase